MSTEEDFDRAALTAVLEDSSDPRNPGPDEMYALLRATTRIAVVGMSRDPTKAARGVPSYLAAKGAEIVPVNPHGGRLLGREVLPTLSAVEGPVDMVLVFRPSDEAAAIVREAMTRPERPAIWLQEGIRADAAAAEARAAGLQVVQDLCASKVHRALGDTLRRARTRPARQSPAR